jgi:hypothetical protein
MHPPKAIVTGEPFLVQCEFSFFCRLIPDEYTIEFCFIEIHSSGSNLKEDSPAPGASGRDLSRSEGSAAAVGDTKTGREDGPGGYDEVTEIQRQSLDALANGNDPERDGGIPSQSEAAQYDVNQSWRKARPSSKST